MDVGAHAEAPALRVHDDGFESALEKITDAVAPAIEPDAVADVEPTDSATEVGPAERNEQVV
jgi:hypothetical protein